LICLWYIKEGLRIFVKLKKWKWEIKNMWNKVEKMDEIVRDIING
jgi:hypothetical protein